MPVVNYYREQNKVVEVSLIGPKVQLLDSYKCITQIDAKDTVDGVYSKVRVAVDKSLAEKLQ